MRTCCPTCATPSWPANPHRRAEDPGTLLFLPLAHCSPGSSGGLHRGTCSGTGDLTALLPALARPADVHPGRAARVPEGIQHRRAEGGQREEGRDFGRALSRDRVQPGARCPGGRPSPACEPSTRCSTGWSTATAGRARRPGPVRRLRRAALSGSATSVASASPCSRVRSRRPPRHREPAGPEQDRHRRPAAARRQDQDRRRRRDLISRKNVFPAGTTKRPPRKPSPRTLALTGDRGADEEGFLKITGRKKEMIVTRRRTWHPRSRGPAPQPRLISQCMVVDAPFVAALITLDPEALGPGRRHGKPADATIASLRDDPELVADRRPSTMPTWRCRGPVHQEIPDPRSTSPRRRASSPSSSGSAGACC